MRAIFWAKIARFSSRPPAFLPAVILDGVAFPNDPKVPLAFIFAVAA
jgi:hypothetical protein